MILFKSRRTRGIILSHFLPSSVIFIWLLYQLLPPLDVFKDTGDEDIIDTAALDPYHRGSNGSDVQLIPKIIHQVYLGWDASHMPLKWNYARQKCIDLHPDYNIMLWNQSSALSLINDNFSWLLPTFTGYRYHVQRADSIRYLILLYYGGIYIDLDQQCEQRLDPLLGFDAFVPGTMTGTSGLNNNVMGSVAGHPFSRLATESLQTYDKNYILPYLTIMTSAGPHYLTFIWKKYLQSSTAQVGGGRVHRFMPYQRPFGRWENEFFSITEGETWATWDTKLFIWEGNHIFWATVFNIVFLVTVSAGLWTCAYSTLLFLLRKL